MPRQVTVADAARLLKVSEKTIRRQVTAGTLPSDLVDNRRLVWLPDEVVPDMTELEDGQSETMDIDLAAELVRVQLELGFVREERDALRAQLFGLQDRMADSLALLAKPEVKRLVAAATLPWWKRLWPMRDNTH
jgi:hypothetical protein